MSVSHKNVNQFPYGPTITSREAETSPSDGSISPIIALILLANSWIYTNIEVKLFDVIGEFGADLYALSHDITAALIRT